MPFVCHRLLLDSNTMTSLTTALSVCPARLDRFRLGVMSQAMIPFTLLQLTKFAVV